MPRPVFTSIDAEDLYKFAESLTLTNTSELGLDQSLPIVLVPGISDEIGLAAVAARLMAIASNLQSLDNKVATAFRDGVLQAEVNRVEHSNVATYADLSAAAKEAIRAGRVTIQKIAPAAPAKKPMQPELTIDDLDLDI